MRAAAATSSTTGIDPAGALASAPVRSSPTRTIALLAVVCTLVAMMQSLIAPLLTVLPPQLNTTAAAFTWAVTAALLAGAVSTPIAGRLGDMLGKKTVLVGLLVPLVVGCAISALATNLPVMLLGRTLQGVALGSIPVSIALLQEVVPPHRRATAIALASASMGIGGGIALPLSAGFAQFFSWRALFWILVGLGLVLAILIAILVPAGARPAPGQRFDAVGALLLAVGLSSFLIALSQGSVWGWTSWAVLGAFGLSAVALLAWATWEFRAAQPLVDLRAATTPVALLTNLASIFTGMAMYITLVATPQILQLPPADGPGLGVSLLAAGLLLLPGGIIQMLLAPVGGRLINARGPKVALLAGIAIIACGYGTMQVALASALGLMVGHMIIMGGIGIAYGAMPALIMSSVSAADIGSATSFNTLMRQIGSSTGSAVVGAVLAAVAVTAGGDVLLTEAGFRISFLIGLGVALAALTIAAFIPYRRAVTSGTTAA
jgi:MFS family permease